MHHVRLCRTLVIAALIACALALPAREAGARVFTIGSSLGVSWVMPSDSDSANVTAFSIPQNGSLLATGPGFRIGTVTTDREIDFGLEMSALYLSGGGESRHMLMMGLDLERHWPKPSGTGPFIGIDGGFSSQKLSAEGNQGYFGVSAGLRKIVGGNNGSFKFQARGRKFFDSDKLPAYSVLDIGIAFDLWVPK